MAVIFTEEYPSSDLYEFKAEATEQKASDYIQTNKTTVIVDTYMRRKTASSNSAYNGYGTDWEIVIDGTKTTGNKTWDTRNTKAWQKIGTAKKTITHGTDGSKKITISAKHVGNSSMGTASGSGSFTLTKIPRASSITATDANIESATNININRADSSFTHTIKYSFEGLTGTIVTKTEETSIGWQIPDTFYEKIPNSKTGEVTLTCTTYDEDTSIGTSTYKLTVTASESKCKPNITAVLIDSNSKTVNLTGDETKLVKYKSTAKITPTATGKKSATISKITVNGSTVSGSYIAFTNVQSETFEVIVTDSRGYTNSLTLSPTIVKYIPLTLTAIFERISPISSEVEVRYGGNYFNDNFGSVANTLVVSWNYREKGDSSWITGGTLTPTINNNTFSGKVIVGDIFDYKKAYEFQLIVADKLSTQPYEQGVKVGEAIFDFGVDANGNNYFFINGTLYFPETESLKGENGNLLYNGKKLLNEDEQYYKDGDSVTIPKVFVVGAVSSSSTNILFSIVLPKRMTNVKPTLESAKWFVRHIGGGYIFNGTTLPDEGTITLEKFENILSVVVKYSETLQATNNTPVTIELQNLKISFSEEV